MAAVAVSIGASPVAALATPAPEPPRPGAAGSHLAAIEYLERAEEREFEALRARYDEYLALNPYDVVTQIERCRFFAAASCGDGSPSPPPARGPAIPGTSIHDPADDERRFLAQVDRSRGFRDCFLPIVDPEFVGADGAHGLADGELVVGVDLAPEGAAAQFAYPTQYLDFHEIVEHSVPRDAGALHLLACW